MNIFCALALFATAIQPQGLLSRPQQADSITIYYPEEKTETCRQTVTASAAETFVNSITENNCLIDAIPHTYDSMLVALQERRARVAYDQFFTQFIDIEEVDVPAGNIPDSVYEQRLRAILSPIQMPYNDVVKRYIITYTTSRKAMMSNILARSQYYFPMIEQELDRNGLPVELRMLPVIESALSPTAISRVGATGLWQFMYTTGKAYGLEITSFIDQRRDPVASTKAACRYLKDLYDIYGDWTLAIAAYNCGPGNVNKAIKRAGGEAGSFWDIYPYLPKETRGYVPSFIAATYAYTYHYHHDITPGESQLPLATDTVMICRPMHFEQISSTLPIPTEIIRSLNPQYKLDIIPATNKSYPLILPMAEIGNYIDNESRINAKDTVYMAQYLRPSNLDPNKKVFSLESFTYRVKSGDTLSGIAKKHHVTVSQLMKWNNLKSADKLRIGQKLEIYR